MEQRRLRLGDILDDYCPRERRVTNHAVVAMIEEDVKQTRCTTCDTEHAYKGARVPRRRKKETPAALYKEVLAGMPEIEEAPLLAPAVQPAPALAGAAAVVSADAIAAIDVVPVTLVPGHLAAREVPAVCAADGAGDVADDAMGQASEARPASQDATRESALNESPLQQDAAEEASSGIVDGPVHRPLIRATLPRIEGQKDARPIPEFTVRHAPGRGGGQGNAHGNFRGERMRMREGRGSGNGNSHGGPNGNRAQNGGGRFHGNRPSGAGGRQGAGRSGGPSGFRGGNNGPKRGRGSRG